MSSSPHFRRQHFSLKDRFVSFLSETLFDHLTYTVRHGLLQGMKRKGGMGFLPAIFAGRGGPSTEEAFFRSLDLREKVVYDIGAFQGLMTLYFARQAKAVISFEPHPANLRRLHENIQLNHLANVRVLQRGLGESEGFIELACDPRMPGAASADPAIVSQVRESVAEAQFLQIPVSRLDDVVGREQLPLPDFIKIDIEGMELSALRGMTKLLAAHRPQLYLEMHGATAAEKGRKAREILEFLFQAGYQGIRHVETAAAVTSADDPRARTGHLFCVAV
jgi:FkbM family methyltransferase